MCVRVCEREEREKSRKELKTKTASSMRHQLPVVQLLLHPVVDIHNLDV